MSTVTVRYADISLGAREVFEASASDQTNYSDLENIQITGVDYTDFTNPCEGYDALLTGSGVMFPDDTDAHEFGYVSEQLSDANGHFDTPIVLTFQSSEAVSATGLWFRFDEQKQTWATRAVARWYRGGTLLETSELFPTAASTSFQVTVREYNRITVTFYALNVPHSRLRIAEYDHGLVRVFGGNEVQSVTINQDVSPYSARISGTTVSPNLSIDTASVTLRPSDNVDFLFQQRQPFEIYRDSTLHYFGYVKTSSGNGRGEWKVNLEDFISVMDGLTFDGGLFTNYSAKRLLSEIVRESVYVNDLDVADVEVTGYLPHGSMRTAFAHVCFAAGWNAATAFSRSIKLSVAPETGHIPVGPGNIEHSVKINVRPYISELQMSRTSYTESETVRTLYDAARSGEGQNITITVNEPIAGLSVTGGGVIHSVSGNVITFDASASTVLSGYTFDKVVTTQTLTGDVPVAEPQRVKLTCDRAMLFSPDVDMAGRLFDYARKWRQMSGRVAGVRLRPGDPIRADLMWLGELTGHVETLRYNLTGGPVVAEVTAV